MKILLEKKVRTACQWLENSRREETGGDQEKRSEQAETGKERKIIWLEKLRAAWNGVVWPARAVSTALSQSLNEKRPSLFASFLPLNC